MARIAVMMMWTLTLAAGGSTLMAQAAQSPLDHSVEQLRHAVGRWNTTTEFLRPDGSVARTVSGTYEFEWVVADRVVRGRSDIPSLEQSAGILFYVNPADEIIEMVSVGADGQLWTMTGPLGGETRQTQVFKTPEGRDARLRFTRFNVAPDRFESRMERTEDGGRTWVPGNHQVFERQR